MNPICVIVSLCFVIISVGLYLHLKHEKKGDNK